MSDETPVEELKRRIEASPTHRIDGEKCELAQFLSWIETDYRPRRYARVQKEFINEHMLKLGLPDIRVYLILCEMANRRRGICWPSVYHLAERLGVSERHIRRSTRKLQQEGLIQKGRIYSRERHQQHNIYKISLLGPGETWEEGPKAAEEHEEEEEIVF